MGRCTDVGALYQAMDVFVLPSLFEGLPLTLIEAQAAGLKCIYSDVITEEAKVTSSAVALPLDVDLWVSELGEVAQGYDRKNTFAQLDSAGYNIKKEAGILQEIYLDGF